MYLNPGTRTRSVGALLLILISGLLPMPPLAGHAMADDRVLLVRDGAVQRQYTVPELVAAIGLTELRVAKDPHFGPDRVFAGFALEPLLDHIGLGDAAARPAAQGGCERIRRQILDSLESGCARVVPIHPERPQIQPIVRVSPTIVLERDEVVRRSGRRRIGPVQVSGKHR